MTDLVTAFDRNVRLFIEQVREHGWDETYLRWVNSGACCCMGPRNGEPFCPCVMNTKTAAIMKYLKENVVDKQNLEAVVRRWAAEQGL